MHYLSILAFGSLAIASPLSVDKRGCVALAAQWTISNFSTSASPGTKSVQFDFKDSLNLHNTHCGITQSSSGNAGTTSFHACDYTSLKFKWHDDTITLEEKVSCSPKGGTQSASKKLSLSCEVFGVDSHCGLKGKKSITLNPTLDAASK